MARRINLVQRISMIEHAMQDGKALAVQCRLLRDSEKAIRDGREPLIPQENIPQFRTLLLEKVDERISCNRLLEHPNLDDILSICWQWDSEKIKSWCDEITKEDENMFSFIKKFIMRKFEFSNYTMNVLYYISQECIENYIDIEAFESRILALQAEGKIPQEYEETAKLFLQGVALWREGKTPEDA